MFIEFALIALTVGVVALLFIVSAMDRRTTQLGCLVAVLKDRIIDVTFEASELRRVMQWEADHEAESENDGFHFTLCPCRNPHHMGVLARHQSLTDDQIAAIGGRQCPCGQGRG